MHVVYFKTLCKIHHWVAFCADNLSLIMHLSATYGYMCEKLKEYLFYEANNWEGFFWNTGIIPQSFVGLIKLKSDRFFNCSGKQNNDKCIHNHTVHVSRIQAHICILVIGLKLACSGDLCREYHSFAFKKTHWQPRSQGLARVSPHGAVTRFREAK